MTGDMFVAVAVMWLVFDLATAQCPLGSVQGAHSYDCYLFQSEPASQYTAYLQCRAQGGILVSVGSAFDSVKINSAADPSKGPYWFGLSYSRLSDGWQWMDQADFNYTNWDRGQPDALGKTCVKVDPTSRKWSTSYCFDELPSVCGLSPLGPSVATPPSSNQRCQQEWTYVGATDLCYKVIPLAPSAIEHPRDTQVLGNDAAFGAAYHCRSIGGDLAVVKNDVTNDAVGKLGEDSAAYWIGLNNPNRCKPQDTLCKWQWTDGTAATYAHWGVYFPVDLSYDTLCGVAVASILDGVTAWQNQQCQLYAPYVCQMPAYAALA